MSRPIPDGEVPLWLPPEEQLKQFAQLARADLDRAALEQTRARTAELGLSFDEEELAIIAWLDTPDKVQHFLNTQIYYNNDHASADLEETAWSPRMVLRTARAHCFEGAMFAYTVDYIHGHDPRLVLLEASQDSEHNLVLFCDRQTGLLGVNAHSAFLHLDGRPARYPSLRAIAASYFPWYYSDRSWDPTDLTLVGYSDPFDLVARFGVEWMAAPEMLWDLYYTYVDDTIQLHYLVDDPGTPHLYPLLHALKQRWIQIDAGGRPFVSVRDLPQEAQELWETFWRLFGPAERKPHGEAKRVENRFFRLTGTTPIDLNDNVEELTSFLERGYRLEQILRSS